MKHKVLQAFQRIKNRLNPSSTARVIAVSIRGFNTVFNYLNERRGLKSYSVEGRGTHAENHFFSFFFDPNSTKLISKHPRLVNMINLNKTNINFHAINPFNKIYH